ncbi:MAG: hypothetical protein IKU59_07265 [Bacteroidales bacterium]|nr:hypothetical protein [Bacteroidales bacterium]
MKKILLAVIAISVTLLFSSCVGLTNITAPQTVALNQGNFRFVKSVNAEIKATYVFGMGGFRDGATADVVEKLIEKANLQPNQALADIRVKTTKKIYLGIVVKRTLTAAASVVEFCDVEINTFKGKSGEGNNLGNISASAHCSKEEVASTSKLETSFREKQSKINSVSLANKKDVVATTPKIKYTRETANKRLEEINQTMINVDYVKKEQLINEVRDIKKWYFNVSGIYPEIEEKLIEIKNKAPEVTWGKIRKEGYNEQLAYEKLKEISELLPSASDKEIDAMKKEVDKIKKMYMKQPEQSSRINKLFKEIYSSINAKTEEVQKQQVSPIKYTRETAFQRLKEINETLPSASNEEKEIMKNDFKRIKRWYSSINPVYQEIENLLKIIDL